MALTNVHIQLLRVLVSLGIINKTRSHAHIARESLPILRTQGRGSPSNASQEATHANKSGKKEGIVTSNLYNGCPQAYRKAWDDYHYLDEA